MDFPPLSSSGRRRREETHKGLRTNDVFYGKLREIREKRETSAICLGERALVNSARMRTEEAGYTPL